ncbi:MAG TPA: nucleoside-diphosphate sugar epimerase/dehydratase [Negativicutes bacterium]|nr:nucleoside-diphosphate sugar epimerase/dehydratase [Negativicutes bacterium]
MDLFKRTAAKRMAFFIVTDILAIILSFWLAFLIRFDGQVPAQYLVYLPRLIIMAIFFIIPVFYIRRLYSFSWAYVSASELISLFISTTVAFGLLSGAIFVSHYFPHFLNFPRSTIFISYILVFIFASGVRFSKRIYSHGAGFSSLKGQERTLIVGAGDAGEQILRGILASKTHAYLPVGFVDDNPMKKGVKIHGLNVLGKISDIPGIVQNQRVKQLIIALPSAGSATIKTAVELGKAAGVRKIKIAPSLHEIIRGEVSLKNLRDVDVEDLLGRSAIEADKKQIESFVKGKVVLITGAAGSIGSELSRQAAKFKPSLLVLLDQDETGIFTIANELEKKFPGTNVRPLVADVTDEEKMAAIFLASKPGVLFHAAAYKHVPLMEAQPDQAVKNNVLGTRILAAAAVRAGVEKFIFISTDKAVNPTSVMGATKRLGEMICQAYNKQGKTRFISVRFGNVLNSRGSVIPIFKEQIRRGGPVEVTHPDMQRYFMLTSEACLLVMQAGALGRGGEVFVLDMGQPVKIVDLAREIIRLSGFKPDTEIAITFIGLRPGEKLFEEILTAEEGTVVTQHKKIFMANMSDNAFSDIENSIAGLKQVLKSGNAGELVAALKEIIPYYK